ncbi:MAG TPA: NAD(P)H-dependent oxidoreductase [Balneolaceae bacterium]|nr:NAD(P)H-dependent oxidoreductase [Balneolaceae bacterium]
MNTLLGIVGSPASPSKTRTAVEVALQAAADEYEIETEILHLAEYDLDIADGRKVSEFSGDTARVGDQQRCVPDRYACLSGKLLR